eukprot:2880844-Pyramimonas_sp.AAC.1
MFIASDLGCDVFSCTAHVACRRLGHRALRLVQPRSCVDLQLASPRLTAGRVTGASECAAAIAQPEARLVRLMRTGRLIAQPPFYFGP